MDQDTKPNLDEVRKRIIQKFWTLLGADPATATGVVRPSGDAEVDAYNDVLGVAETDEDDPYAYLELSDYTLEDLTVADFFFGQATLSGIYRTVAHDLGDGWWYVIDYPDDDTPRLLAAVPKDSPEAEQLFDDIRRSWLGEMGGGLDFTALTSISGYDLTATPDVRCLVDATLATVRGMGVDEGVKELNETICSGLMLGQAPGSEIANDGLRSYLRQAWDAIVTADPQIADELPPGLATLSIDSPAFDTWLDGVALRWRDTGEAIDKPTARVLRVVMQYLAAAC